MDWTSLVKTIAPWIGTALGGPLGGMAVTFAANALGISQPTADKLKAALAGITPEQSLALKAADQAFQAHMAELGYQSLADLEGLAVSDRKDARGMQIAAPSMIPAVLTVMVTIGFFGVLYGMSAGWLHIDNNPMSLLLIGSLQTAWATCLAFWMGTTRDSGQKTALLAQSKPGTNLEN